MITMHTGFSFPNGRGNGIFRTGFLRYWIKVFRIETEAGIKRNKLANISNGIGFERKKGGLPLPPPVEGV